MRRAVFLIVLLCILVLAGIAHAVTLEQGWYAQIRSIYCDGHSEQGYEFSTQAWMGTAPGVYGPFRVTPDSTDYRKTVDVPTTDSGVVLGTALELPLLGGFYDTDVIDSLWVDRHTNYDATRMRLQLIQRNQSTGAVAVLWEQKQSNDNWHAEYIGYNLSPVGLAFRVVAVPEPQGILPLSLGLLWFATGVRRRFVR